MMETDQVSETCFLEQAVDKSRNLVALSTKPTCVLHLQRITEMFRKGFHFTRQCNQEF